MKLLKRSMLVSLMAVCAILGLSINHLGQYPANAQSIDPYSLDYEVLSLSGNGTVLAAASNPFTRTSGSLDTYVTLFNAQTLEVLQVITMPTSISPGIFLLSLNQTGSKFAFSPGQYSGAYIYDVATGSITTIIPDGYIGGIDDLEWNPVDNRLAIGAGNVVSIGNFDTYITQTNNFIFLSNSQNTGQFTGLDWSYDGNSLIEGRYAEQGGSEIFSLQRWSVHPNIPNGTQTVPMWRIEGVGGRNAANSPQGSLVAAFQVGTGFVLLDSATGSIVRQMSPPPSEFAYFPVWSPNGTQIAGYGYSSQYWIWDATSGQITQTVTMPTNIADMVWLPNGAIVTAAVGQELLVNGLSVQTWQQSRTPTPTNTPSPTPTNTPTRTPPPLPWTCETVMTPPSTSATSRTFTLLARSTDWSQNYQCQFTVPPVPLMQTYRVRFRLSAALNPIVVSGWIQGSASTMPTWRRLP